MKRTILLSLSLLAFLLTPGMAAAEPTPAPAAQGCNDLSFLSAAPMAPITSAAPAVNNLNPLAGAVEVQGGGCCAGKMVACQAGCACGVFEFNCNPATCQSSCICNIC